MKGHEAVARALRDHGVSTVFGLIGDANMYHVMDFIHAEGGQFVGAVAEGAAVSMADGYARVTGHVGVVSVTHGPGAANAVNALVEAVKGNSPVLLLTGETPVKRGHAQEIDLSALFSATGAGYHRVRSADQLADDIAIQLAQIASSKRPIVLDISIAIQLTEVDYKPSRFQIPPDQAIGPDDDMLDSALGLLVSSNRPLILAGRGAVEAGAASALIELADVLGAPLANTASAKDIFAGHPYDLGTMGSYGFPWAVDVISRSDCVAAFGAGLHPHTTYDGDLLAGRRVIQCVRDPGQLARYSPVDIPIVGDARVTAELMVVKLRELGSKPSSFRAIQLGDSVCASHMALGFRDCTTDESVDMRTAMIELEKALPVDKVVVTDAGRFMAVPWRYLHVSNPRNFVQTAAWASIGLGLGTAIGAAVADTSRPTVVVAGDGGAMMSIIELSTAVRERLPLVLVVLNDGAYGSEYAKLVDHGFDPTGCFIDWPDFAEIATSLGATGVTIRNGEDLGRIHEVLARIEGPIVIDIKCDPHVDHRRLDTLA